MSTYTPIASITLASTATSVTFNNIPQTYTDLVLMMSISESSNAFNIEVNGDTGSNYSRTRILGNGTTVTSGRTSNTTSIPFNYVGGTNNFSVTLIHFMNYSNTTTYKTVLSRSGSADVGTAAQVALWRNTSAITSMRIFSDGMTSGSTFNLYGIANASITNVAKATGGDSVTTDGTYWYHIFRSSGTFTPTANLTADYLVVAGGGGAAQGGGGGGGLRCTVTSTGGGGSLESALTLTLGTSYTVTVGAGGTGATNGGVGGTAGSNSVFSTITSTGGGQGGGGVAGQNGSTGGSGGGASNGSGVAYNGGSGTSNQGYAGGNSATNTGDRRLGGGGGGANAGGANGTTTAAGNGGAGVATSITGSSVTYGGGGGGGAYDGTSSTGGSGGGGNGNTGGYTNGNAGTANRGGGGGGTPFGGGVGGAGGSGIVVIRYSAAA
jgi:hypothetical protein